MARRAESLRRRAMDGSAQAAVIVSDDDDDLLALGAFQNIPILTAPDFLARLAGDSD